jgi:hypothetical protein
MFFIVLVICVLVILKWFSEFVLRISSLFIALGISPLGGHPPLPV